MGSKQSMNSGNSGNSGNTGKPVNQGEGDIEADRRYREHAQEFVESARGKQEIENPKKLSPEEEKEVERAERAGKQRAKEEDPNVERDYDSASDDQDKARNKLL